jgi:hypothetical protein
MLGDTDAIATIAVKDIGIAKQGNIHALAGK